MPKCISIRKKKQKVCLGDMKDQITLQDRDIKGITDVDVDFTETFTAAATVWSMIETVQGTTTFDASNTEIVITHKIYVRFDPTITSETWIELESRKFDIVTVTNLDERKEFQLLLCRERGSNTQQVNFA